MKGINRPKILLKHIAIPNCRIYIQDYASDSYFIEIGDTAFCYNAMQQTDPKSYVWDDMGNKEGIPMLFDLKHGENILKMHCREAGTRLDKIIVINDLEFIPD